MGYKWEIHIKDCKSDQLFRPFSCICDMSVIHLQTNSQLWKQLSEEDKQHSD